MQDINSRMNYKDLYERYIKWVDEARVKEIEKEIKIIHKGAKA